MKVVFEVTAVPELKYRSCQGCVFTFEEGCALDSAVEVESLIRCSNDGIIYTWGDEQCQN